LEERDSDESWECEGSDLADGVEPGMVFCLHESPNRLLSLLSINCKGGIGNLVTFFLRLFLGLG
jgi:hypothetical protein